MATIGVICPAATGHLNPLITLCKELQRRGHRPVFYQPLAFQAKVEAAGLEYRAIGADVFPAGALEKEIKRIGELSGKEAFRESVLLIRKNTQINLAEIPERAREDQVDFFLVDEVYYEGGTIAEALGVPFATVSNALLMREDPKLPPFFTAWEYQDSLWARLRNRLGYHLFRRLRKPKIKLINEYRQQRGLKPITHPDLAMSRLVHLAQQPREFDFPRELPPWFHCVGPLHAPAAREACAFPFEQLNGKPLVYASMGTLQNRQGEVFGRIAEACADLPVQLVISLGGGSEPESLGQLSGNPLVVKYAPQLELLERAALCITHAGLNTALECLSYGVPMVALPITNDQPGVGARIAWHGVGECLPLKELNAEGLREKIRLVLENRSYAENSAKLRDSLRRTNSAALAADCLERVIVS